MRIREGEGSIPHKEGPKKGRRGGDYYYIKNHSIQTQIRINWMIEENRESSPKSKAVWFLMSRTVIIIWGLWCDLQTILQFYLSTALVLRYS